MDHKSTIHVKDNFLEYHEKKLSGIAMSSVEEHLRHCAGCASYYRMMDEIVNAKDRSLVPEIEADPYLPSKIKTLFESGGIPRRHSLRHGWISVSLGTAVVVIAIGIGIFLGRGIAVSTYSADNASIATSYLEAFTQRGFGDYLQSAIDSTKGVQ
jgi:predicted anti-sigma-YlaC factor YlaD